MQKHHASRALKREVSGWIACKELGVEESVECQVCGPEVGVGSFGLGHPGARRLRH